MLFCASYHNFGPDDAAPLAGIAISIGLTANSMKYHMPLAVLAIKLLGSGEDEIGSSATTSLKYVERCDLIA